mmetsp:Transcript_43928/g.93500  ORF Transcript_43928/g.93500 Transcript_43928/m.93500 type:complete len:262 (-) Transcript_43928:35-820(-)
MRILRQAPQRRMRRGRGRLLPTLPCVWPRLRAGHQAVPIPILPVPHRRRGTQPPPRRLHGNGVERRKKWRRGMHFCLELDAPQLAAVRHQHGGGVVHKREDNVRAGGRRERRPLRGGERVQQRGQDGCDDARQKNEHRQGDHGEHHHRHAEQEHLARQGDTVLRSPGGPLHHHRRLLRRLADDGRRAQRRRGGVRGRFRGLPEEFHHVRLPVRLVGRDDVRVQPLLRGPQVKHRREVKGKSRERNVARHVSSHLLARKYYV